MLSIIIKFTSKIKSFFLRTLRKVKPRVWWILLVASLVIGVSWYTLHRVRANRVAEQLAERETLLAEIALLQGQVEIAEGLWYSRAREVEDIRRVLMVLQGENSELLEQINQNIEQPVVTYQTEIVYRDRLVYVRDEGDPERDTSEGQVSSSVDPETSSTVVNFDLYRRPWRLIGQTDSSGPSVEISVEQVDPFVLDVVLTRQHANSEWNLFLSDPNKELDVAVRNFYVQDVPPPQTRFLERIRYGSQVTASRSTIAFSALVGLDFGRTTLYGGPSWASVFGDAGGSGVGGSLGFLMR